MAIETEPQPAPVVEPRGSPSFGAGAQGGSAERDVLNFRRHLGYGLAVFAIAAIVVLFIFSFCYLNSLSPPDLHGLQDPTAARALERFFFLKVGAHAVCTAALLFFFYQVLRAGERMMIPYWWNDTPGFVALMLGIKSPLEEVESVVGMLEKVTKLSKELR